MVVLTALRRREPRPQAGNQGPRGHTFKPKSNGGPADIARELKLGHITKELSRGQAARVQKFLREAGRRGRMLLLINGKYIVRREE